MIYSTCSLLTNFFEIPSGSEQTECKWQLMYKSLYDFDLDLCKYDLHFSKGTSIDNKSKRKHEVGTILS